MESMSYTAASRDIEFVLYEQLKLTRVLGSGVYEEVTEDDCKMIVEFATNFVSESVIATNLEADRVGAKWDNGKVTVPECLGPLWDQVKEQGWISLKLPAEQGGQGLPAVIGTVVDELFIGTNPAFSIHMGLSSAATGLLANYGSPEMLELYGSRMLSGEWQGTMCLTEAGAGSDVGASLTRATPNGDDTYQIKGTKVFISAGDHQLTENHIHLVLARLPDAPAGSKGLSLFLVPKFRVDSEGTIGESNDVYCSKIEEKMGIHASPTCVMNFGDNDGCIGYLVGEKHRGMQAMFHMMNEERIVVGLQGQALASAMYFHATKYAKERLQGSDISAGKSITDEKVAIVSHPDVRRMLMTIRALSEGGRALLYYTSMCQDLERTATEDSVKHHWAGRMALLTPVCKGWGSDSGCEATSHALQVYGGSGFCTDYPAEQYLRDARIAPIYEGTNGIQALDLLFRKVLGMGGKLTQSLAEEIGAFAQKNASHAQLGKEAIALGAALQELVGATQKLGKMAGTGKLREASLGATPYLTALGNVVVDWLLLDQAIIADKALEAFDLPEDSAERRAALEDNENAAFYHNKIQTARFFSYQILSQNSWKLAQVVAKDPSALEAIF